MSNERASHNNKKANDSACQERRRRSFGKKVEVQSRKLDRLQAEGKWHEYMTAELRVGWWLLKTRNQPDDGQNRRQRFAECLRHDAPERCWDTIATHILELQRLLLVAQLAGEPHTVYGLITFMSQLPRHDSRYLFDGVGRRQLITVLADAKLAALEMDEQGLMVDDERILRQRQQFGIDLQRSYGELVRYFEEMVKMPTLDSPSDFPTNSFWVSRVINRIEARYPALAHRSRQDHASDLAHLSQNQLMNGPGRPLSSRERCRIEKQFGNRAYRS